MNSFARTGVQRAIGTVLVSASTALWPTASIAGTYSCVGKISQITTDPNGTVNATFEFTGGGMAWQDVCNLNTAAYNVPVAACRAILATLLSAKLSGNNVVMFFDNTTPSCSAAAWRPLRESGWYYGPSIQ